MQVIDSDTIAAVATGYGTGGIGIIRISGSQAFSILYKICDVDLRQVQPYRLSLCHIIDPHTHRKIDQVLISCMPGPRSYTVEDMAEINCHGGRVILQTVLELIIRQGARLAEPGEFTRRAFLNGRLDLVQAEAVQDLIASKTARSAEIAEQQLEGALSKKISSIRGRLLSVLVAIEATIDFPDDIEAVARNQAIEAIRQTYREIVALLSSSYTGHIYRDGIQVVIAGLPNAGKSSLLNYLLGSNRAIVSEVPGTTRDTIEEYCNLDGVPIRIVDTAGIRDKAQRVETEGIKRTWKYVDKAELVLFIIDLAAETREKEQAIISKLEKRQKNVLLIGNKSDLLKKNTRLPDFFTRRKMVRISIKKETGLDSLRKSLVNKIKQDVNADVEANDIVSNPRHIEKLTKARDAMCRLKKTIDDPQPVDLWAIDLRTAVKALGQITGQDAGEEVIDSIFKNFCVGK